MRDSCALAESDCNGKTALHGAILAGAELCALSAAEGEDSWSRLARARPEVLLIESPSSPLAALPEGRALEAAAAGGGHVECVRSLLEAGAQPQRLFFGKTALHLAAAAAALPAASKFGAEVVALLVSQSSSLLDPDPCGNTPLHYAASTRGVEGFPSALQAMLACDGAVVSEAIRTTNRGGCTPLHLALRGGSDLSAAALIIAAGAPCDAADHEGTTPLHLAAAWGQRGDEIVQSLLAAKAHTDARDCWGRSPADVALACGGEGSALLLAGVNTSNSGRRKLPTALLSHPSCLLHSAASGPMIVRNLLSPVEPRPRLGPHPIPCPCRISRITWWASANLSTLCKGETHCVHECIACTLSSLASRYLQTKTNYKSTIICVLGATMTTGY